MIKLTALQEQSVIVTKDKCVNINKLFNCPHIKNSIVVCIYIYVVDSLYTFFVYYALLQQY